MRAKRANEPASRVFCSSVIAFVMLSAGCSSRPPLVSKAPDAAPTLDAIVAPASVWEEGRTVMGWILDGSPHTVLIPGNPGYPCALANEGPSKRSLECQGFSVTADSTAELVRQVNAGEVKRAAMLALLGDPVTFAERLGLTSDEIGQASLEVVERISVATIDIVEPAMQVRIEVMARGEIRAYLISNIGTEALSATSLERVRGELVKARPRIAVELKRRAQLATAERALEKLLATFSFDGRTISYGGVSLGMSTGEVGKVFPFAVAHRSVGEVGREWRRFEFTAKRGAGLPPRSQTPSVDIELSPIASVDLLDHHAFMITAEDRVLSPPIDGSFMNAVCDLASTRFRATLKQAPATALKREPYSLGCTLTYEGGDSEIVLSVSPDALRMVIEGEKAKRAPITQQFNVDQAREQERESRRRPILIDPF